MSNKQVFLTKESPILWRVTFNNPPVNIFGPKTIPQLNEILSQIETDEKLKVVVFDSAIDGFFMTHYDFLSPAEETNSLPPGPTGLLPWPDMLVRLSRAPVVSIAKIRGRATGCGSELALACDMRFASRELTIMGHFEVGVGIVPGGAPMARLPRLIGRGRALEVLLGADDIPGDLAVRPRSRSGDGGVLCIYRPAGDATEDQVVIGPGASQSGRRGNTAWLSRWPAREGLVDLSRHHSAGSFLNAKKYGYEYFT